MQPHYIVVGAGVIGAAVAFQLARRGVAVTVLAGCAPRATDASFGWVNANFFADDTHFQLRNAGIFAYGRLTEDIDLPLQWLSGLCWETSGAAFDKQFAKLKQLGADVRVIDSAAFRKLEPHVADVPDRALLFKREAATESGHLADMLLQQAQSLGARVVQGANVLGLATKCGNISGVQTDVGIINADSVLVAAGTGSSLLMDSVGVRLPMLKRPGLMLRTQPIAPIIHHVLASATQELRQSPNGAILAPLAASHQSDTAQAVLSPPDVLAKQAMLRIRTILPSVNLEWDTVMIADRPMPQDGLPVVGAAGPKGLYVATMHSGITLAALMGELVAEEMCSGVSNATADLLATYRPQRFSASV